MKKLFCLLTIFLIGISLSACGQTTPKGTATGEKFDKFVYDASKETPEQKAKYDQALEDCKPVKIVKVDRKELEEEFKVTKHDLYPTKDQEMTIYLENGEKIYTRKSFGDSYNCTKGESIRYLLNENKQVIRIGVYYPFPTKLLE